MVNLTLAVHLKEKIRVPDAANVPNDPNDPNDSAVDSLSHDVSNVPSLADVSTVPGLSDIPNVPNSNSVHSVADVPMIPTVPVDANLAALPIPPIALNVPMDSNGLHVPISSGAVGESAKKTHHAEDVLNGAGGGEPNVFLGSIGHDIDLDGEKDEPVQIEGALSESSEEGDSEESLGI